MRAATLGRVQGRRPAASRNAGRANRRNEWAGAGEDCIVIADATDEVNARLAAVPW